MSDVLLSKEGFKEILLKSKMLKEERELVVIQLDEAREKGDLSENADYDAAKKRLREIDSEITKNERIIKNCTVVDVNDLDKEIINVLAKVTLKSLSNNKEVAYQLVSEAEANVAEKKISVSSPLGEQLLHKKVGDIIKYKAPIGILEFKILKINYD